MNMKSVLKNFGRIDASSIANKKLAKRVSKLQARRKQGGFTLLELLVVVAILAAIAGTATIALQDTDARASAAAHVAMMDELNKGIRTFRVLNRNSLPSNWDSLMSTENATDIGAAGSNPVGIMLPSGDGDILGVDTETVNSGGIISGVEEILADIGIEQLRYIDASGANPPEDTVAADCAPANLQDTISDRGNAVVAGNIFNGKAGNGCGLSITLNTSSEIAYWTGNIERLLGPGAYQDARYTPHATNGGDVTDTVTAVPPGTKAPIMMAVGIGPASNLFDASSLGGMTSVPVYRHVAPNQYNRFIGLFHVANATMSTDGIDWLTPEAKDQVSFVGTVDGAGDTKEEELGEWDGTRNTI